jgi:hypothetical protein
VHGLLFQNAFSPFFGWLLAAGSLFAIGLYLLPGALSLWGGVLIAYNPCPPCSGSAGAMRCSASRWWSWPWASTSPRQRWGWC